MIRRCLKSIAVVMIFLPEPVTTAIGVALLTALLAIPSQKRLSRFKNLEELVKRSLKSENSPEYGHDVPLEKIDCRANNWFDNRRVPETILHHTLKTSLPQYEASPGASRISDFSWAMADRPLAQLHTLKVDWIPQNAIQCDADSEPGWLYSGNVVHHTLKE
jgi:hypothetical protein